MDRTVRPQPGVKRPAEPAKVIAIGFMSVITIGTILLSLPMAREDGATEPLDALFTATSSVCVTGLVIADTGKTYTTFGEVVTIILIQIGGLGYMTAATAIALLIGRQLGIRERVLLREAHGQLSLRGMVWLTRHALMFTFIAEAVGATILAIRFSLLPDFCVVESIYAGVYHSVSAFCNAGFDIMGPKYGEFASLTAFPGDVVVTLTVSGLFILGGLGFVAVTEIYGLRKQARFSLHTKLVIASTLVLIVVGTAAIMLLERGNPLTLASLDPKAKFLASYFQAVTPRTAGFSTINVGGMQPVTLSILAMLMFIGASPGGTGGGIKTTTFVLIVIAIWAIVRGKRDTEIFGRRIPTPDIFRALAIVLLGVLVVVVATVALTFTELSTITKAHVRGDPFIDIAFEVVSAFGTVGLSTGITPLLSPIGRLLIILVMFVGRIGPLTAFAVLTARESPLKGRLPEEHVAIG